MTQSAVSKQVRLLESHLNMRLFFREHRGLQLTEAGRNYLPVIERAFNALEQGTRSFLGHSNEANLHIKVNYSFATLWLSRHIHDFMHHHPEINLTVSMALWEQDFSDSIADIQIHYGHKELFSEQVVQLTQEKIFPVCSRKMAKRLERPQDMCRESILDLTGIRDNWDYWAAQTGNEKLIFENHHYFGTFEFSVNMARAGHGITLGQSSLVAELLNSGELCAPFDSFVLGRDHYFIQQNQLENTHPNSTKFMDWIINKTRDCRT